MRSPANKSGYLAVPTSAHRVQRKGAAFRPSNDAVLNADVPSFYPGIGAMSYLNRDSEPDTTSHENFKMPNVNSMTPIGSGSLPLITMHTGPPFSTDNALNPSYRGQVEFLGTYLGKLEHINMTEIFNHVLAFAISFGPVRAMSLLNSDIKGHPRFRVEYFSVSDANKVCLPGESKELFELNDHLLLGVRSYIPYQHQLPLDDHHAIQSQLARDTFAIFNNLALDDREPFPLPPRRSSLAELEHQRARSAHLAAAINPVSDSTRRLPNRAPEHRQAARRGRVSNSIRQFSSGIHNLVNHDVMRRSGPSDIEMQPQMVILRHIEEGIDCRTTVMVRNIPNRMTSVEFKEWLDETSRGLYDFAYLRVDFANDCNVGYAFVNFCKPEHIVDFVHKRVGRPWNIYNSDKTCEISYATIQGQDCLIAKFRNSSVMKEWAGYQPKIFYSVDTPDHEIPEGKEPGDQAPFPEADNPTKLKRSLDNAVAVGLYPPKHGSRGRGNGAGNRTQYDRGTPRAIHDENAWGSRQHYMINTRHMPMVTQNPVFVHVTQAELAEYFLEPHQYVHVPNLDNFHRGGLQYSREQGRSRR